MSKYRRDCLAKLTLATALALTFTLPVWSQEQPGDACSPDNAIGRSGGTETGGKGFMLTCQSGIWSRIYESDATANLGIKQSSPKAPLHVGGELIIGETTGLDCDTDRKGGLRWNDAQHTVEMCDGSTWKWIAGSAVAAGPEGAIQFNNSSALAGSGSFVYTSAGNVGIGKTNPTAALDVYGGVLFSDGSGATTARFYSPDVSAQSRVISDSASGRSAFALYANGASRWLLTLNAGNSFALYSSTQQRNILTAFNNTGYITIGSGATATGVLHVNAGAAGAAAKALIVQGAAAQTANLTEWQNDSGSALARVDKDGKFGAPAYCDASGGNCFNPASGIGTTAAGGPDRSIQFNNGSALAGSSTFIYTSSGRVGLGVTAPIGILDVNGNDMSNVVLRDADLAFYDGGLAVMRWHTGLLGSQFSNDTAIHLGYSFNSGSSFPFDQHGHLIFQARSDAASRGGVAFYTGLNPAAPSLSLLPAGRIGANTIAPQAMLHVNVNSSGAKGLIIQGAASQSANLLEIQDSTGTPSFMFTSNGALGIGTSGISISPTSRFHITTAGNNIARIETTGGNTVVGYALKSPLREWYLETNRALDNKGDFSITDLTGGTNRRFLINGSGFVGINAYPPVGVLQVNALSAGSTVQIVRGVASQTANLAEWQNSSGIILAVFSSAGHLAIGKSTPAVALDVVGDIAYTGDITDVSDRRLKQDIHALSERGPMLDLLGRIRTYSFVMIDDQHSQTKFGVMAQELEEIFPELVKTAPDALRTKSVNYIGLVPLLIQAVQEQQQTIKRLEDHVQSQQQTIERLESHVEMLETRLLRLEEQAAQ